MPAVQPPSHWLPQPAVGHPGCVRSQGWVGFRRRPDKTLRQPLHQQVVGAGVVPLLATTTANLLLLLLLCCALGPPTWQPTPVAAARIHDLLLLLVVVCPVDGLLLCGSSSSGVVVHVGEASRSSSGLCWQHLGRCVACHGGSSVCGRITRAAVHQHLEVLLLLLSIRWRLVLLLWVWGYCTLMLLLVVVSIQLVLLLLQGQLVVLVVGASCHRRLGGVDQQGGVPAG